MQLHQKQQHQHHIATINCNRKHYASWSGDDGDDGDVVVVVVVVVIVIVIVIVIVVVVLFLLLIVVIVIVISMGSLDQGVTSRSGVRGGGSEAGFGWGREEAKGQGSRVGLKDKVGGREWDCRWPPTVVYPVSLCPYSCP